MKSGRRGETFFLNTMCQEISQLKYDPQKHHQRSIRLRGFDYFQQGWYFVTIVTQNHDMLFGKMVDGRMVLNQWGEIVKKEWLKTAKIRKYIELGKYIIMLNYIHRIIVDENDYSAPREGVSGCFDKLSNR